MENDITPQSAGLALASLAVAQQFGRCWKESGHRGTLTYRSFMTLTDRLLRDLGAAQHVQRAIIPDGKMHEQLLDDLVGGRE